MAQVSRHRNDICAYIGTGATQRLTPEEAEAIGRALLECAADVRRLPYLESTFRTFSITLGHTPDDGQRFRIVRMFANGGIQRRGLPRGLTLAEAQEHCRNPETSSRTCTTAAACARTKRRGAWFEGFEAD